MERLTVEAIEDPHGLRAFIRFPEILYRDDPCWVPPLRRDERARLFASNPFVAHADARLFLARWDREVVGRVAAIVDRWHLERWEDGAGFFEAIADDSVAGSLYEAVRGWPRAQGLAGPARPIQPVNKRRVRPVHRRVPVSPANHDAPQPPPITPRSWSGPARGSLFVPTRCSIRPCAF
jgi:hypothetical protein